jgi:LPS export ABC transporter permease LptG
MLVQILLMAIIVPKSQEMARSKLRSSNVDYFEGLIKPKKFNDTVKGLTIFAEGKNEKGELKNIYIKKNNYKKGFQITFAKKGVFETKGNKKVLVLYDGQTLNQNKNKVTNFDFSKSDFGLGNMDSHLVTHKKIQEQSTISLIRCVKSIFEKKNYNIINCDQNNPINIYKVVFERLINPLYLPVLILISLLFVLTSKENLKYTKHKYLIFLFGLGLIILSESSLGYVSNNLQKNILILILPIIIALLIYIIFIHKLKLFKRVTRSKFLINGFLKSFLNIFFIMMCLVLILNILKEIDFFSNKEVPSLYPIYLSIMSSPSIIFEMFPFIFLIATQFFFLKLFNNDEINIFKYSGLKNIKIINILSLISFVIGIFVITIFYSLSSNLQHYYLQIKNQFSDDKLYLAVINKNGLWMKDVIANQTSIINSSKIDNNFLTDTFITTFDDEFNLVKSLQSDKIDIKDNEWLIYDVTIFEENMSKKKDLIKFKSNFNQKKIESLFSNLSSLSLLKLIDLRQNYKSLNYSTVDVDMQIYKIVTYPLILVIMTILSSIIMLNTKKSNSKVIKIIIGLFFSVIIYYINNFFNVMGSTEKLPIIVSVWTPIIFLSLINVVMLLNINEK